MKWRTKALQNPRSSSWRTQRLRSARKEGKVALPILKWQKSLSELLIDSELYK